MPYAEEKRGGMVWQLIGLAYFGPFCLCGLALLTVILLDAQHFKLGMLLVPVVVGLLFGTLLQWRFRLPGGSFLYFTGIAYFAQLVYVMLLMTVLQNSAPFIDTLDPFWHYPIITTVPIILAAVLTICSMGHFGGRSAALHFSLFFAIAVAAYSGVLTTTLKRQ